jgi:predicted outer membrane repeat protein
MNFSNNFAKVSGGAIYISGCGISFIECSFSNNSVGVGNGNDIYQ